MSCEVCQTKVLKRDSATCANCGITTCPKDTWFYVDESNIAITKNARPQCRQCAEEGKK